MQQPKGHDGGHTLCLLILSQSGIIDDKMPEKFLRTYAASLRPANSAGLAITASVGCCEANMKHTDA